MRESVDYYCVTNLHKDTNPELTGYKREIYITLLKLRWT
jgi:hypothetical protein